MSFIKSVKNLQSIISKIKSKKISLDKKTSEKVYSFKEKEHDYYVNLYRKSYNALINSSSELNSLIIADKSNEQYIRIINLLLSDIEEFYRKDDIEKIEQALKKIIAVYLQTKLPENEISSQINIKIIPEQIRADFRADMQELEKCFISGCYRSAIMLCGRLLEIALHRKYYEITGHDILEKNPGIGLGKIIAKLNEKNIKFEPGLTQQIHLINQLRISSVHKQKDAFYPTKQQTHAMILYTTDVLEKLFRKN